MERDACLSHGSAFLLHERLCTSSDEYIMNICQSCQTLTEIMLKVDQLICKKCMRADKSCSNVKAMTTTYSTKLLITYLAGLGIKVKFIRDKKEVTEEDLEEMVENKPKDEEEENEEEIEEEEEEEIEEEDMDEEEED